MNGLDIARRRIAEEAVAQTGVLDLGRLGLSCLPDELLELVHLRLLNLGSEFVIENNANVEAASNIAPNRIHECLGQLVDLPALEVLCFRAMQISDLTPIHSLKQLNTLDCSNTSVSDLSPLAELTSLRYLECSNTSVSDLTPLAELTSLRHFSCWTTSVSELTLLAQLSLLQHLDCSNTSVSDLSPLAELTSLRHVNCRRTQVSKLTPLAELTSLQHLDFTDTTVSDLRPLAKLKSLQHLACPATTVSDLTPLARLTSLQQLDCRHTQVHNLEPLTKLASLQYLDCSNTSVNDLNPLAGLTSLQHLCCMHTKISNLMPLAKLESLQHLECGYSSVRDLGPLARLTLLKHLDCQQTQVNDLTPLAELTLLQYLAFWSTSVRDLTPLQELTALQTLFIQRTQVSDLMPLARLTLLQRLTCRHTRVKDLTPLAGLTSLQRLDCGSSSVSDLTPLAGLMSLQRLDCGSSSVSDLTPLAGLTSLQHLNCGFSSVSDLTPLVELTSLRRLNITHNRIEHAAQRLWRNASLTSLIAYKTELRNFPSEILSQGHNRNCLPAIRAHLADLNDAPVPLTQLKLMVLGNGRIGKTQICNRLCGLSYEGDADSTHGVTLSQALIPDGSGTFAIWDFGGQDIYHGTHALFLQSRAVFLLVWTPESDDTSDHKHGGVRFRNQPLSWWLDYVKRFGSKQSPLVIVQNQLDTDYDRGDHPAVAPLRKTQAFCRSLAYSAATDEGREVLDAHLKNAAKRFSPPLIGPGRLRVMKTLISMRELDSALPAIERRHQTLTLSEFESICDEKNDVSDKEQLLVFLHNAGVVFWRKGLFQERVVLDQAWVLEAIYTVFNREKCLQQLRNRAGRFTQVELGLMVWDELYSPAEQALFVSFMCSCGICFQMTMENSHTEPTYIAPDLLPENWPTIERLDRWGIEPAQHERCIVYDSLPPALLRNLICKIGERAGIHCDYWRNGFYGFEVDTRSRVVLEQRIQKDWRGEIRVSTRGDNSQQLLDRMIATLGEEESRLGLFGTVGSEEPTEALVGTKAITFGHSPDRDRTFYVSYAWADRNQAVEHSRERIVDDFCNAAAERKIKIHRDRNDMEIGDRISTFINRLARSDRIFVVLSDKYLKSPFCMHELHEIWLQSRSDSEQFLKRVLVYTEDDARVWTTVDRTKYAVHWKVEYESIRSIVNEHGINVLGDQDKFRFGLMEKYSIHVGDMLNALTDVLQPRNLDELIDYGFDNEGFDDT